MNLILLHLPASIGSFVRWLEWIKPIDMEKQIVQHFNTIKLQIVTNKPEKVR